MARPLRIEFPGACYHVINRGNYRRNLFAEKGAAAAFERVLGEAALRFHWRIHAYVVMRNHFHLAVEVDEPNLSEGMKWLQGTWSRRFNGYRRQVGRPFQGRYKALLVEPGHTLGQVCHYIHLNPVRAKVVTPALAGDYPWSSLGKFAAKQRPVWLEPETVLEQAGGLADTAAGWRQYRQYLEFLATDEPSKRELVAARLSRGWWVGTQEFRNEMRREAARRGMELDFARLSDLEPEERQQEREAALVALAAGAGIDLSRLPSRKSAPPKVLLAAALKRTTAVSNGWLARRLAMGQPASASQFVRRLELDAEGRRGIEQLLSRVKK